MQISNKVSDTRFNRLPALNKMRLKSCPDTSAGIKDLQHILNTKAAQFANYQGAAGWGKDFAGAVKEMHSPAALPSTTYLPDEVLVVVVNRSPMTYGETKHVRLTAQFTIATVHRRIRPVGIAAAVDVQQDFAEGQNIITGRIIGIADENCDGVRKASNPYVHFGDRLAAAAIHDGERGLEIPG